MQPLGIEGGWLFTPRIHTDNKGRFHERFRGADFAADLGYRLEIGQANCSVCRRGVIRDIHFADVPPGQAKYVTCEGGVVLDVVVDGHQSRLTQVRTVGSGAAGRRSPLRAVLSEGLGHAFMAALSEQCQVKARHFQRTGG